MRKDRKAHGKIHKILHSRYFWVVLGFALSFVQLLVVFILLYKFFIQNGLQWSRQNLDGGSIFWQRF